VTDATPTNTQVRVAPELHRLLKVRAAQTGTSVKALVEQGALIVLSQSEQTRNDRAAS
jgi:predicted HicB family RNase H-like nuclease